MSNATKYYGAVAEFDSATAIYQAAKQTSSDGYTRVDSHTPFPVHGMDSLLKHGPSQVGWICLFLGIAGIVGAQLMMWWMNAVDYEIWVSGKQPYAWPSTIPITFECMVLLSAFGAVFGMFAINGLPRFNHPVFNHSTIWRATDDRFFLSIEANDPKFDPQSTVTFLESLGGTNVELVQD